jgi:hypothetical protein
MVRQKASKRYRKGVKNIKMQIFTTTTATTLTLNIHSNDDERREKKSSFSASFFFSSSTSVSVYFLSNACIDIKGNIVDDSLIAIFGATDERIDSEKELKMSYSLNN